MDSEAKESARDRLSLLELLLAGQERRHEVMDLMWDSRDEEEAVERLRGLVRPTADPRVLLDMRLGRLVGEQRARLTREAKELRRLLREE